MQKLLICSVLLLLYSYAQADMYSCVDASGVKTFKNIECGQDEKSNLLAARNEQPYTMVESTGERQYYRDHGATVYFYRSVKGERTGYGESSSGSRGVQAAQSSNDFCTSMRNQYKDRMNKEGGTIGDAVVAAKLAKEYSLMCGSGTQSSNDVEQKLNTVIRNQNNFKFNQDWGTKGWAPYGN